MRNEKTKRNLDTNSLYFKSALLGVLFGLIVILLATAIFAFAVASGTISSRSLLIITGVIYGSGALVAGLVSSKILGSKGMLIGAASALIIYILLLLTGLLASGSVTSESIVKLIVMCLCGAAGGIFGVNSKKHKKRK